MCSNDMMLQAAINDYLLIFARNIYNDPTISGTLPTELGQLASFVSM